MSRRKLLNLTTGGVAALFLGAILFAISAGGAGDQEARIALMVDQQETIQEVARDADDLAAAQDLDSVTSARTALGQSIYLFDRNLAALLDGGTATDRAGRTVELDAAVGEARQALAAAVDTWRQVGMPLSDLAAGSFSVYSAAGRTVLADLDAASIDLGRHLGAAANAMNTTGSRRTDLAKGARGLATALGILCVGLLVMRRWPRPAAAPETVATAAPAAMAPPLPPTNPFPAPPPPTRPQPYTAPVDLEDLSASVDQLTLDMQSIAGSSDKMQQAIDSVGHALQGMLYSLNEMARDTADGERVVRGADTAAAYTAEVASALVENVREMSRVVGNVAELAQRTRQTAARLDSEAARSDRTGKGFTLAVANEVRSLAERTGSANVAIENTMADLLGRIREYEEAIGQIIQHVSSINRVSRNLGEVMLNPPTAEVVPAPAPPVHSLEPVGDPALAPQAPAVAAAEPPLPSLDEFAAETAAAIDEAAAALEDAAPVPAPFSLDAPAPQEQEPPATPAPEETEPAAEPEAQEAAEPPPATFSLDPEGSTPPTPPAPASAASAVFVLSRAQNDETSEPADDDEAHEPELVIGEPGPEPAPEPAVEPEPEATAEPVTEVEEPAPAPEPVAEATEPAPAADDDGAERAVSDGDNPNIFILNAPPEPSEAPPKQAEPVAETVPPDDD
jgi:hypothetical protein